MSRFAVLLYPSASLQEITCLTAALSVWYGEGIDYIAGEDKEYQSEEGLRLLPTKTAAQADPADYDCVILPGTIDPLPALYDEALIAFLHRGIGTNTVFAAISSAPLLLCKAGLLEGKKFTAVFVSSLASLFPMPLKATYAASKRFLLDFATALRQELRGEGVNVLALCPAGMVTTEKIAAAIRAQGFWGAVTTNPLEVVARKTLDRALAGKAIYIPGALNRTLSALGGTLPRTWVAGIVNWRWKAAQKKWLSA